MPLLSLRISVVSLLVAAGIAAAAGPAVAAVQGLPDRVIIEFKNSGVGFRPPMDPTDAPARGIAGGKPVPGPSRNMAVFLSLPGNAVFRGDDWDLKRVGPNLYHLRSAQWKDRFWSIDLAEKKAFRVTDGIFGAAGGRQTPLRDVAVKAMQRPDRRQPDIVGLDFASASLIFDPPTGRGRFLANGEVLETYGPGEWSWSQEAPAKFRLRHRGMQNWHWDVYAVGPRLRAAYEPDRDIPEPPNFTSLAPIRFVTVPAGAEETDGVGQDVAASERGGEAPARSDWIESEKTLYRAVLKAAPPCDVLVVPIQVQGYAVDRPGRSLMTRYLSERIARTTGASVANPTLVSRALGETARTFRDDDVRGVAEDLKARVIVRGFAGHGRNEKMRVTVQFQQRTGDRVLGRQWKTTVAEWRDIPFSDERPPEEAFRSLLDNVVARLPSHAAKPQGPRRIAKERSIPIPASVSEMIALPAPSPVVLALRLQALGTLVPTGGPVKERLFERSLVALDRVDPGSADYPLLKARALLRLHRRPAAAAALGRPRTPEEQAFAALLDGDLPALATRVAEIRSPLPRLIAEIELDDLRRDYGAVRKAPEAVPAVVADRPDWLPFVLRRLVQSDAWNVQSNLEIKRLMDRSFPVAGYTARTVARGAFLAGGGAGDEAELSVNAHRQQALQASATKLFPPGESGRPVPGDEFDLLVRTAEANLYKSVYRTAIVVWAPEKGLAALDRLDMVYRGHPTLTALRTQILWRMAEKKDPPAAAQYKERAREHAANVFAWSEGQTQAASHGLDILAALGELHTGRLKVYDGDYPARNYWRWADDRTSVNTAALTGRNAVAVDPSAAKMSVPNTLNLLYTTIGFHHFRQYYSVLESTRGAAAADRYLEANARRFAGHPSRVALLVEADSRRKGGRGAVALYEQAIADNPESWQAYGDLGAHYVERGDFGKAAEVFLRYPLLRGRDDGESVRRSNTAFAAGNYLFWNGAVAEAVPLFGIAARSGTGAGSEMKAALTLSTLDGDYRGAASHALDLARRYNNPEGWSIAFALIHVTGHPREAWQLFDATLPAPQSAFSWRRTTAILRREGKTAADIAAWLSREPVAKAAGKQAGEVALAALLVDRPADPALADRIAALEPEDPSSAHPGVAWKLTASRFARAYAALRTGKSREAFDLFHGFDGLGNTTATLRVAAAPYLLLSAARIGKMERAEPLLANLSRHDHFAYHLSQAYIHGSAGDHAGAVEKLKAAGTRIPYGEPRFIPPWYQLVEACEWLHRLTGRGEYKELALKWAKTHQRLDPIQAWAYGVEARLTAEPQSRTRAIALTIYLDPNSGHLAGTSRQDREKGREWLQSNNPFTRDKAMPRAPGHDGPPVLPEMPDALPNLEI